MAIALKERRAISGAEAVAVRPDGTLVAFLAYPTPLFDSDGELVGAVNVLVNVTGRKGEEHSSRLLAAIVESSDDAIVSKDLNGIIATWNRGAERLFGYSADEAIGQPMPMLIPPERHDEEAEIIGRIRRGERVEHYETVRRRKDGSLIDVSLTVSPVQDEAGRIVGASKIAHDITERRRAGERQRLMLREMNHRVKNLLSLAGSIVTISARHAETTQELVRSVRDRLAALGRAHTLTLPDLRSGGGDVADASTTLTALMRRSSSPIWRASDVAHRDRRAGGRGRWTSMSGARPAAPRIRHQRREIRSACIPRRPARQSTGQRRVAPCELCGGKLAGTAGRGPAGQQWLRQRARQRNGGAIRRPDFAKMAARRGSPSSSRFHSIAWPPRSQLSAECGASPDGSAAGVLSRLPCVSQTSISSCRRSGSRSARRARATPRGCSSCGRGADSRIVAYAIFRNCSAGGRACLQRHQGDPGAASRRARAGRQRDRRSRSR